MDTGTLIQVVDTLENEAKWLNYILENQEDYPLTNEEEYGIQCSIRTLENLLKYFQDTIEENIAGMEMAQGK
jgi:hypothetical protein